MILKGSQRGGAKDLARHLLKDENEHVEVHELRGFASDTLMGALNEAYAISRGTRCRQFLYSLSLKPPAAETVSIAAFEAAITRAEERLNLTHQPRAIVFHEKEGRRHAHVVWSRINAVAMKAVPMAHDRRRLTTLSRELFLEHGWTMPVGLANREHRDPRTFTLAEWRQAKRIGADPRATKAAIQDAWAISDDRASLTRALDDRGFALARGDKAPFVVIDVHGEVYALPKMAGVKTKAVRARLGDAATLPSTDHATTAIATHMRDRLEALHDELAAETKARLSEFERRRQALVAVQRRERQQLRDRHQERADMEARARQARFRQGLKGLWDRLRGEHARIRKRNEAEAAEAGRRDAAERGALVTRHLEARQALNLRRDHVRQRRDLGQVACPVY